MSTNNNRETLIDVMLCVNSPDNGNYCGRIAGMSVDDFVQLEPRVLPEPRCQLNVNEKYFGVHRRKFRFESHQTWVGNWCWDAVWMRRDTVAELIAHLLSQTRDDFSVWGFDVASGEAAIRLMDMHQNERSRQIMQADVLSALMLEAQ